MYVNRGERFTRTPPGFRTLTDLHPPSQPWSTWKNPWKNDESSFLNSDTFYPSELSRTWNVGDSLRESPEKSSFYVREPLKNTYDSILTKAYYGSPNFWSEVDSKIDNFGTGKSLKEVNNIWKDTGKSFVNPLSVFNQSPPNPGLNGNHSDSNYPKIASNFMLLNASKNGYRPPRMRRRLPSCVECVFCKNNGSTEEMYRSHILKDPEGNILCPILRAYNCPVCNNGGGNKAHTLRYCPQNRPNGWRKSFQ